MRILIAAVVVILAPALCRADLPAPGSTYHLLFATSNFYRTTSTQSIPPPTLRFGNIAGADYQVTSSAFAASLPSTGPWDGVSPIYRAILSITGDNARDRLSVSGPVLNMHGTELASGHADLFDGSLAAAVDYDELGALHHRRHGCVDGVDSDRRKRRRIELRILESYLQRSYW